MKILGALLFCFVAGTVAYVLTQRPKVWCNRQWAGIALTKGGYRSWHVSFCDGEMLIGDKFHPVVLEGDGRIGYYRWPRFGHIDVRKLGIDSP